jgi:hypothetical protein
VLGLRAIPKPAHLVVRGGVWFMVGEQQLHVGTDPDFRPERKGHPAFLVRDLTALRRRLEAAGAPTRDELPLPGFRRFYADDPVGNRLEFVEALRGPPVRRARFKNLC